jgi:general secretion pathway protein A
MQEQERYHLATAAAETMVNLWELEWQQGEPDLDGMMRRLKDLSAHSLTTAVMTNPNQTSDTALLKAIAAEFRLKPPRTKQGAFDQLQEFLAHEVVEGRTPLLLLDEAQDLRNSIRADRDMLRMTKALTNLMLENERLIQIILFGQLEVIPLLKKRRELMSRVAQFGVLSPLTKEDTVAMMEHRWNTAGGELPLPFGNDASELIYQATKGLPRDIIKVSNSALTHGYAERQKTVNLTSAQFAIEEHHLGNGD